MVCGGQLGGQYGQLVYVPQLVGGAGGPGHGHHRGDCDRIPGVLRHRGGHTVLRLRWNRVLLRSRSGSRSSGRKPTAATTGTDEYGVKREREKREYELYCNLYVDFETVY